MYLYPCVLGWTVLSLSLSSLPPPLPTHTCEAESWMFERSASLPFAALPGSVNVPRDGERGGRAPRGCTIPSGLRSGSHLRRSTRPRQRPPAYFSTNACGMPSSSTSSSFFLSFFSLGFFSATLLRVVCTSVSSPCQCVSAAHPPSRICHLVVLPRCCPPGSDPPQPTPCDCSMPRSSAACSARRSRWAASRRCSRRRTR